MKDLSEICSDKRMNLASWPSVNKNTGDFFGHAWVRTHGGKSAERASVIFGSNEDGVEHVSVAFKARIPTWDEMCIVKDIFWREEERCIQIHPKKSEYVNLHPNCLHIWRPKNAPKDWPF